MNPQDIVPLLQPLREPPAVSWWPPAPGWWLLGALLLAVAITSGIALWRRHRRLAPLREAQRELASLQEDALPAAARAARLSMLWRRVAVAMSQEAESRTLTGAVGEQWIQALNALPARGQAGFEAEWADLAYRRDTDSEELSRAMEVTKEWLRSLEKRR